MAHMTNSALLWMPSFRIRLNLWASTVLLLKPKSVAAARTVFPSANNFKTCRSRVVSALSRGGADSTARRSSSADCGSESSRWQTLRTILTSCSTEVWRAAGHSITVFRSSNAEPGRSCSFKKTTLVWGRLPRHQPFRFGRRQSESSRIHDYHIRTKLKNLAQALGRISGFAHHFEIRLILQ